MVNLRQVRYFVEIADAGSFKLAAERVHVAPATISEGLKGLERQLGVELMERSPRSVQLTTAGEKLIGPARAALAAAEDLESEAQAMRGHTTIRVGTVTGFAGFLLDRAAQRSTRAERPLSLEIEVYPWDDPSAGLADRSTDVAILVCPTSADGELERRTLWHEPLLAVIAADHPLGRRSSVSLDQLDRLGFIWCEGGDDVAHRFACLDHIRGGPPPIPPRQGSPQELLLAVRRGRGVCVLPGCLREVFGFGELALVPISDVPPTSIDLAWRRDRVPPRLQWLVDSLVEELAVLSRQAGQWNGEPRVRRSCGEPSGSPREVIGGERRDLVDDLGEAADVL